MLKRQVGSQNKAGLLVEAQFHADVIAAGLSALGNVDLGGYDVGSLP